MEEKGHTVEIARRVVGRLDSAFADGSLVRTADLDRMLGDLALALDEGAGQRLGGKSAEAARFILRAVERELANA
jgi:hypothetical protein